MSLAFLNQLLSDVFDAANADEAGSLRLNALVSVVLARLEEDGVLTAPQVAYFKYERGNVVAEVHGYACDTEDDVLSLFFCVDATSETALGQPASVVNTPKEQLDRAFRRLESFVRLAQEGRLPSIEESQHANELVGLLTEPAAARLSVELNVVTTGVVTDRASAGAKGTLRRELWDLIRLERLCGGAGSGSITIDFVGQFGRPLPCLVTAPSADGLRVLLTCIPGDVLATIYNTHRSALLERNVRSFLQFTGKVNQGIRNTLMHEAHRFLPYNNGLSATAAGVEFRELDGRLGEISLIRDFQIVNGGQTTASIATCSRRDHVDLTSVIVPMKLTVVPRELLEGLVPQISRYANTQNRIQDSDFSANDPWHIELERISRHMWTRAGPETPRGTRWFYERSRGQYADALAAHATAAGKRQFRSENPSAQKLTKTDVARIYVTWDQYPAVARKGAQKCFGFFMKQLGNAAKRKPDEAEFRRLVALAILFRCCERLYSEMGHQGSRAEVVTHAIAKLSHICQRRIDSELIWREQDVPGAIQKALKYIIAGVNEVIVNPPPSQRRISEWAKKDECWAAVLERRIDLPEPILISILGQAPMAPSTTNAARVAGPTDETGLIMAAMAIPAEVWFAVSGWAAQTRSLQPWQRGIAYAVGTLTSRGRRPSIKQARQARKLILEAHRLGFNHDALEAHHIDSLKTIDDTV